MTLSKMNEREKAAYEVDTFQDLSVQEAMTIIAVFAAQMVPDDCEEDVRRIGAILKNHPDFVEKKENILKRINKFANSMLAVDDQSKAVDIAKDVLTPEMRKTAYALAAEVALSAEALTDEKKAVLDTLAAKLSIDSQFARRTTEKFSG